ncbi:MAG: VOC family protein [Chloroflexi bacterium]|nr:VOC family protein [Chloroflexota bacterium]
MTRTSSISCIHQIRQSPNHYWWDAVHVKGGGLIDFCLRTDDIRGDYAIFEEQGVEMSPLVGLSRVRFDGYHLSWLNNEIYGQYQGLIPFIIEDETAREERVPKETEHENGVMGIESITLAARDLDLASRIMQAALSKPGAAVEDERLAARGLVFELGSHQLEYLTPADMSSPLHEHIARNRPVPYRIRFKTAGAKFIAAPQNAAGSLVEFI